MVVDKIFIPRPHHCYQKESTKMKKIVSLVLSLILAASLSVPVFAAETNIKSFDDVAQTHWAYAEIMICAEKGAIDGTRTPDENGVGSFKPDGKVTLGQFLTVLSRLLAPEYIENVEGQKLNHWADPYYKAAIEGGIIKGLDFSSDAHSLNTPLTREDMAYILASAAEVNGETLQILPRVETLIKDYDTISSDRKEAVKQAYSNGLIEGYTDGRFGPEDTMTRAQMATVVCRLMQYKPRGTVTVPEYNESQTVVSQDKSQYVATSGDYKGYLKAGFSRQKELEALSMIKLGEDSKGVYVTFTAPSLPDVIKNDFTFEFTGIVYKSNGDYFAQKIKELGVKPGETRTVYFVSYEGTSVKSSQIGEMALAVAINNSTGYQHMFTRSIESSDKTKAYAQFDIGQDDTVAFDSTSIWKGIGL